MWTESTDMQQCTAIEQQVLAAIVPDEMLQFLAEMVSFQSLADNETPAQRHIAAKMRAFGFETDVWDIDFAALRSHPAFSWEVERSTGLGVVGTIGADRGGKSLLLNGHIDVVPAGDRANWHSDPYQATVRDGRMYGRGGSAPPLSG